METHRRTRRMFDGDDACRDTNFHTRGHVEDKIFHIMVDESCKRNMASTYLVEKLNLDTYPLEKPLWRWYHGGLVEVTKQTIVPFSISKYHDNVICDVAPIDSTHLLLGRPWRIAKRAVRNEDNGRYSIIMCGKKWTLLPISEDEVRKDQMQLKENFAKWQIEKSIVKVDLVKCEKEKEIEEKEEQEIEEEEEQTVEEEEDKGIEEKKEKEIEEEVAKEIVDNKFDNSLVIASISSLQDSVAQQNVPCQPKGDIEHVDFVLGDNFVQGKEDFRPQIEVFLFHHHSNPSMKRRPFFPCWLTDYCADEDATIDVCLLDRILKIRGRIFSKKGRMMRIRGHQRGAKVQDLLYMGYHSFGAFHKVQEGINIEDYKPKSTLVLSILQDGPSL